MTVPWGLKPAHKPPTFIFLRKSRPLTNDRVLRRVWLRCGFVHLQYRTICTVERLSLARTDLSAGSRSGKATNQLINLSDRIVDMGSNTQTVTTWCCHNASTLEMGIERHRAKISTVPDTNYLRLLTR